MSTKNTPNLESFDEVRELLVVRLASAETAAGYPEDIVRIPRLDFVAYFSVQADHGSGTRLYHNVTYDLMREWGLSETELFTAALSSMRCNHGLTFVGLDEWVGKPFGIPESDTTLPIFVLSDNPPVFGAAYMLDKDLMDGICREIDDPAGLLVLPASVHEVIVLPRAFVRATSVRDIVRSVNRDIVKPTDRLSDSVYAYTPSGGLRIAAGGHAPAVMREKAVQMTDVPERPQEPGRPEGPRM